MLTHFLITTKVASFGGRLCWWSEFCFLVVGLSLSLSPSPLIWIILSLWVRWLVVVCDPLTLFEATLFVFLKQFPVMGFGFFFWIPCDHLGTGLFKLNFLWGMLCLGFDMVEVDSQRLKLERRGVGILLRISCGWLVFMLFFSPVAGLRPLRDRTNSWGDEVCLLCCN